MTQQLAIKHDIAIVDARLARAKREEWQRWRDYETADPAIKDELRKDYEKARSDRHWLDRQRAILIELSEVAA